MKKVLLTTLLVAFFVGLVSISSVEARRDYRKTRVHIYQVTVINQSPRVLRGVATYTYRNRKATRRFIIRPRSNITLRADRYSYIRFRYNGKAATRKVIRNNQRVFLR